MDGYYYLLFSIAASVSVSVLLKLAPRYNASLPLAVTVNYFVAASLTIIFLHPTIKPLQEYWAQSWIFILLGILLPSVFLVMARSVTLSGIVLTDAAQRLSLLITIFASFTVLGDSVSLIKGIGIACAFIALLCLLIRPNHHVPLISSSTGWLWLIGVWLGFGMIDILLKKISQNGVGTINGLIVTFSLSALVMTGWIIANNIHITIISIISGILLGALNFTNIYTYIRAHQTISNPSIVFTTMNIGVIVLATLVGTFIFRERINKLNILGLAFAVAAIVLYSLDNSF